MTLRARSAVLAVAMIVGLSSCASSDESSEGSSGLAGMYQTTAYTESRPCEGAGMALPLDPPYFRVVDDEFSPSTVVDVHACETSDEASCDEFPLVFLAESIGNDTFHTEQTTRTGDDPCFVTWTGSDVRKTPDGVDIATERRTGEWTGADCTGDLDGADVDRAAMLPCSEVETLSGTKL